MWFELDILITSKSVLKYMNIILAAVATLRIGKWIDWIT
jgi:hypothetical protein